MKFHSRKKGCSSACERPFFMVLAAAGLLTPPASAQTPASSADAQTAAVSVNLNITPKRLVLDRGNRAGTAYIFNQGNVPATFDIALVERVMLPNGEIKAVSELRDQPQFQPLVDRLSSAQPMLVATPRRITLAPGKGQTIRVRAMQPANGPQEYRTHLTVTTVPPRESGITADQAQTQSSGQLSFRITSVFGLSIPVIVRPGPADVRGAVENARIAFAELSPDGVAPPVRTPVLRLDLRRLGASSLFGNVEVRSMRGGEREAIGLARGVGVYPEIDVRTLQIPLRRAPRPGEQIEITFTDDDAAPGRVIARLPITGT